MDCIVRGGRRESDTIERLSLSLPIKTEDQRVGWHHRLSVFEQTSGDGEGQGSLAAAVHGVCRVRHTRQKQPIKYSEASGTRPVLGGGCSDKGSGLGLEKPIKETFPPARRWALEAAGSQPAQGPVLPWALLCARPRLSR